MRRTLIACLILIPLLILLLPAAAIAIFMCLFAAAVRSVAGRLEPAFIDWTQLIHFDRRLGWKPRPLLRGHYLALNDDVFSIETDEEGWPGQRPLEASDVVVIGDSFAFGYGVDADQSFAGVARKLRVKAVGAPGYSMVHGVRLLEHFGSRLRGKLVVWFAFPENDLQDNLAPEMHGYRAPFARFDTERERWEIFDRHLRPLKWELSSLDSRRLYPAFCVPGAIADRAYAACDFLIARAQRTCRDAGAHLVLVTIPHPLQLIASGKATLATLSGQPALFDADLPDRRIAESCRRHGVPLVAGIEHLSRRDYKRREGIHWNEAGHRRMAKLLDALYAAFGTGTLRDLVPSAGGRDTGDPARDRVRIPAARPSAAAHRGASS